MLELIDFKINKQTYSKELLKIASDNEITISKPGAGIELKMIGDDAFVNALRNTCLEYKIPCLKASSYEITDERLIGIVIETEILPYIPLRYNVNKKTKARILINNDKDSIYSVKSGDIEILRGKRFVKNRELKENDKICDDEYTLFNVSPSATVFINDITIDHIECGFDTHISRQEEGKHEILKFGYMSEIDPKQMIKQLCGDIISKILLIRNSKITISNNFNEVYLPNLRFTISELLVSMSLDVNIDTQASSKHVVNGMIFRFKYSEAGAEKYFKKICDKVINIYNVFIKRL